MNKKIIRVIIYEGPEEIIDRYEIRNLKGSISGGVPFLVAKVGSRLEQRMFTNELEKLNIPTKVKITAETILTKDKHSLNNLEADLDLIMQNLVNVLEQHDLYNLDSPAKHGAL